MPKWIFQKTSTDQQGVCMIKNFFLGCPEMCIGLYDPVCGSDLVTYSNECYLDIAKCQGNPDLHVAHTGVCDICQLFPIMC